MVQKSKCHQSSVPIVGFGWIFWLKSCVKFRTAGKAQWEHNNLQLWLEQRGYLNEATRLVFFGMQFDVVQDWQLILMGFWNTIPQYLLSLFRNRTNTLSVRNLTKTPNKNTYTICFCFFSNVLTFETPSCDVCKRFALKSSHGNSVAWDVVLQHPAPRRMATCRGASRACRWVKLSWRRSRNHSRGEDEFFFFV